MGKAEDDLGNGRAPMPHGRAQQPVLPIASYNVKPQNESHQRIFIMVALVCALAAGVATAYCLISSGEQSNEEIAAIASAEVDYRLPQASDMANATSESLLALLDSMGAVYYDNTGEDAKASGGASYIKLPEGMELSTAATMYLKGIDNLSASDAATLLNGSWRITLSAGSSYDCRLKFAQFNTGSDEAAVLQARDEVGLGQAAIASQGIDSNGNTYIEGSYDYTGGTRNWRIAACPLSEVYSVDGLPENSSYVVVSLTD